MKDDRTVGSEGPSPGAVRVNVYEAKTKLSEYLKRVERGETIVLCRRNRPIAELRPVVEPERAERPIGLAKDTFSLPETFFEPLPDDIVAAFVGEGE